MINFSINDDNIIALALQKLRVYLSKETITDADSTLAKTVFLNMFNDESLINELSTRLAPFFGVEVADKQNMRLACLHATPFDMDATERVKVAQIYHDFVANSKETK
jgi:hypothetical protein